MQRGLKKEEMKRESVVSYNAPIYKIKIKKEMQKEKKNEKN